ncbi:DUF6191 domain-containing protein [Streptomyces sp. NPDC015171]|uniref:DUF6191 domain-containing protein n=1 Tax=Streptomyces sp. NPDC015171 TaxID=3364945 RepID=UPI0036FAEE2E
MGFAGFMTLPRPVILLPDVPTCRPPAFPPCKWHELTERRSSPVLGGGEEDRVPPHCTPIDLKGGTAVIRVTPGGPGS